MKQYTLQMGASLFNVSPEHVTNDNGLLFNDGLDHFRGYTVPVNELRQKVSPQITPVTEMVVDIATEEKEEPYMDIFDFD